MGGRQETEATSGARIPIATEILSYLGGAFAVAGMIILLSMFWDKLGVAGQLGLTGMTAAACLLGGVMIGRIPGRAAHRLEQFLLLVGVVAVGAVAAIAAFHVADPLMNVPDDRDWNVIGPMEWAMLFGFLGGAVAAGVAYWRRRFVLQQIAVAGAVALVIMQGIQVAFGHYDFPAWVLAIGWLVLGLTWGGAGLRGLLSPGENTALALSGTIILAGLFVLLMYNPTPSAPVKPSWPMWLALGGAALLLGAGIALKKAIVVGFGTAGVVIFLPLLLAETFQASIGVPVSILVLGVALMAIAAGLAARLRRIPVGSELLGYVGGAFALGAGLALVLAFADDIGMYGQLAVCLTAAVTGLVGGFGIGRIGDTGAKRLEQFLLLVGVAGMGATVGLAAYRVLNAGVFGTSGYLAVSTAGDWGWFLGAAAAAVTGGAVWWFRRSWLQQIAFGVSVALASVTVLAIPQTEGPDWVVGLVVVVLGIVWGVLAFLGRMEPPNAAFALSSLGVLAGFLAMTGMGEGAPHVWAMWSGMAACIAMVAGGLMVKRYVIVGVGAVGVWQFLPALVDRVFPNSIAGPIVVLVMGAVFVGGGVVIAIRAQSRRRQQGLATR